MEVPFKYEREEDEEVMGMDLETTRVKKSSILSHPTKKPISPTNSDSSCVSTELSGDSNLEHFANMGTNNVTKFSNQNHKVVEVGVATPVLEEEATQKVETLTEIEEINVAEYEGTNGFSVHQNGSNIVHSVRESNGGDKEMDVGSNSSSFSKSPDTAVGFKYAESLLDVSSSSVISTNTFKAEQGEGSQNRNTGAEEAKEPQPEVEEYDVERVIQKQETHDLYCPNCRSCITKRVILRRRKRKLPESTSGEEISWPGPVVAEESQPPSQVDVPDSHLEAISCFSCFRIFVPNGGRFLCWDFKPKAGVAQQPDGTLTDAGQAEDSITDSTGTIFPLWVVTCCQPAERKKPDETAASLGSTNQPISEHDAEVSPHQTAPPLPPSDVSSTPEPLLPENTTGRPQIKEPQGGVETTLEKKHLYPILPYGDTPSSETPSPIIADEGRNFPLVTCCQPSGGGKEMDHPAKLDGTGPLWETPSAPSTGTEPGHLLKPDGTAPPGETPSTPSGITVSDQLSKPDGTVPQGETLSASSGGTGPPLGSSDENPVPSKPKLPAIHDPDSGISSPYKPISPIKPNDEIPSPFPPYAESPAPPGTVVFPVPPKPQAPVPSGSHGAEPLTQPLIDVEAGRAREPPRPGVSGVDIIKAIVYGGLIESITSLSVITSAAGGDATTLNIVALGLANVFGGLIVLVHNLRLLKHEHNTSDHYEAQLGRPGHYMVHAIVAIISYLVFGLMSPVIYGFTFRKSDDKDYKLATLAAAALASIAVLSAAKAYVRNPPKGYIKTIFYYLNLGFMVSGLGYIAGHFINILLIKLGVFDSTAPDNVPVLATGAMNGAWLSY